MTVKVGVQRSEGKREEQWEERRESGDGRGPHQHQLLQGQARNSPAAAATEPAEQDRTG